MIKFKSIADFVYSNKDVGFALIHQIHLKNLRYAGAHKYLKYYIGFSKKFNDKKIVDLFNKTFKKQFDKGLIQRVLAIYQMEPAEI